MTKPLFSLSYSINQSPSVIWEAWQKVSFWQKVWYGKSQLFSLPAVSSKTTGQLILQPLLPQYILRLENSQAQSELGYHLTSPWHSLFISYTLTGSYPTVLNVTLSQEGQTSVLSSIFDWLAKPYLKQHANKLADICSELSQPIENVVLDANTSDQKQKSYAHYPTIGFFFWQLINAWQSQLDQSLKSYNLTSTQWLVLMNLMKLNEGKLEATASSLAKRLNLNEMHVSDIVTTLVKKNFVHKLKLSDDRRKFQLTATSQGKITAIEANTVIIQTERKFFNSLDPEQNKVFARFISQIATADQ